MTLITGFSTIAVQCKYEPAPTEPYIVYSGENVPAINEEVYVFGKGMASVDSYIVVGGSLLLLVILSFSRTPSDLDYRFDLVHGFELTDPHKLGYATRQEAEDAITAMHEV